MSRKQELLGKYHKAWDRFYKINNQLCTLLTAGVFTDWNRAKHRGDTAQQSSARQGEERHRNCQAQSLSAANTVQRGRSFSSDTQENGQPRHTGLLPTPGHYCTQPICFWFALVISVTAANFILLHLLLPPTPNNYRLGISYTL